MQAALRQTAYLYLLQMYDVYSTFNPSPAKSSYLNFHPLDVACRYRDPQLQVA